MTDKFGAPRLDIKHMQQLDKGGAFEVDAYNKGDDSKGDIDNTSEAKDVINEKSKTESGKTDLPTITGIK